MDGEILAGEDDISMFFGGCGDMRHFYGSLVDLDGSEKSPSMMNRRYHFTLNDVKPAILARAMVMFCLLDELATSENLSNMELLERQAVIFYVFAAQLIPRVVFDRLHQVINSLIETLEARGTVLPWVQIHPADRRLILQVLRAWKREDLLALVSPEALAAQVTPHLQRVFHKHKDNHTVIPPGCLPEFVVYSNTLLLLAPLPLVERYAPELRDRPTSIVASIPLLKSTIKENWMINTTILDEEWFVAAKVGVYKSINPFELARQFDSYHYAATAHSRALLFCHLSSFFEKVALAIRRLRGRMKTELIVGDAIAAMDAVRYRPTDGRILDAPVDFDCVHLSSAPDYIGGSFVNFIYGTKILKNPFTSRLTSRCSRNIEAWESIHHFHSEYMLASTADDILRVTQAHSDQFKMYELPQSTHVEPSVHGYKTWCRVTMDPLEYEVLMPRSMISDWLFAHFFKTVQSASYNLRVTPLAKVVLSPLNLTHFFHLLIHLGEIGYPRHWLADVLRRILDDEIVTTARPPRTRPRVPEETPWDHPSAGLSAAPFIAEMSTLAVMFQRILPFYIFPKSSLPPLRSIYLYSMSMAMYRPVEYSDIPTLVLIFFREDLLHRFGRTLSDIPWILYPRQEPPGIHPLIRRFREEGCVMMTTFEWTGYRIGGQTASFWMREDVIQRMLNDEDAHWVVALWSTITWFPVTRPAALEFITKVARWSV